MRRKLCELGNIGCVLSIHSNFANIIQRQDKLWNVYTTTRGKYALQDRVKVTGSRGISFRVINMRSGGYFDVFLYGQMCGLNN